MNLCTQTKNIAPQTCVVLRMSYLVITLFLLSGSFNHANAGTVDTVPFISNPKFFIRDSLMFGEAVYYANNDTLFIRQVPAWGPNTINDPARHVYIFRVIDKGTVHNSMDPSHKTEYIGRMLTKTGKNDRFALIRIGNRVVLGDSSVLRVYDISDMKNPVETQSFSLGEDEISYIFKKTTDTLYVIENMGYTGHGFNRFHFDKNTGKLTFVDSLIELGAGRLGAYSVDYNNNAYFQAGSVIWARKYPLTGRPPDHTYRVPQNYRINDLVIINNRLFAVTDSNIMVYDISDISDINPIDTLFGRGTRILKYKNLLIFSNDAGGAALDKAFVYNISKPDKPKYVGILIADEDLCVDTVTNIIYNIPQYRDTYFTMHDLTPFISETPVTYKNYSDEYRLFVREKFFAYMQNRTLHIKNVPIEYKATHIELFNCGGQKLLEIPIHEKSKNVTYTLPMLPASGRYIVKLGENNSSVAVPFVIPR